MAEKFRDEGRDVLLFAIISIVTPWPVRKYPHCWAVAFSGRLSADPGGRDGRSAGTITSTKTGSITSVQAVYVPAVT